MRSLLLGCAVAMSAFQVANAAAKGVQVVADQAHQRVEPLPTRVDGRRRWKAIQPEPLESIGRAKV
jgi:hypothetical protein